jgi:hypothetical protein
VINSTLLPAHRGRLPMSPSDPAPASPSPPAPPTTTTTATAAPVEATATPARLVGSFFTFVAGAALGAVPALAAVALLWRTTLSFDRSAFVVLAVFAVAHVVALAVLAPRLEKRGRASVRYTLLVTLLVWLVAVAGTLIGARAWRARAAAADATRAAAEAGVVDAALAAGGFRRIVLDRYVPLHDLTRAGDHYFAVGGSQVVWLLDSPDAGASWRGQELDARFSSSRAVVFPTATRGYVLASSTAGGALLRTDDGGATFTDAATPSVGWSLACAGPDRCWLAGFDPNGRLLVHATADGGRSWIGETALDAPGAGLRFSEPVCAVVAGAGAAAAPAPGAPDSERVVCLSSRTTATGSTGGFALVRAPTAAGAPAAWTELAVAPGVQRWVELAAAPDGTLAAAAATATTPPGASDATFGGLLARSTDGGATFTVAPLVTAPGFGVMDVDFVDAQNVYAISGDLLYRSADAGKTFVAEPAVVEYGKHGNLFLRKAEFSAPDHGVVIKSNGALLVRTSLGPLR